VAAGQQRLLDDRADAERPGPAPEEQDAQQEGDVAGLGDEEGFDARGPRLAAFPRFR